MERTTQQFLGLDEFVIKSSEAHYLPSEDSNLFATTSDAFNTEISCITGSLSPDNATQIDCLFLSYPRELLNFGATCCVVFAVLGSLGNFISILALSKCKRLGNPTTTFIVNLGVADLLFCGITMPLSAIQFLKGKGYLNEVFCKLFPLILYWNLYVSLFSVIAITVNRYILVVHSRFYSSVYTKRNIAIMITFSWLMPFLMLIFPLLEIWGGMGADPKFLLCTIVIVNGKSPKQFFHMTAFGLPLVIFIASYAWIFYDVRKASKRTIRNSEIPKNYIPFRKRKELQVLRVLLVMFILYFVCYFPAFLLNAVYKNSDVKFLNVLSYLGVYLTNVTNPVIYIVMSKEYRRAYKEFLCH